MSLSISMKTPSRDLEKSPIDQAITTLAVSVAQQARGGGLPGGPALDLTFLLSTAQDRPPFDGMRMGGYTPDNRTLFFEAVVPEAMGHSPQASHYVAAVLQDMVDNAADYFAELDIAFDNLGWQQALTPMLEAVVGPNTTH